MQLHHPDAGFGWYLSGGIFVSQISVSVGSEFVADTLSDWIDGVLEQHGEEVSAAGGLLGIHDWRLMRKYTSRARSIWFERMKRRPRQYLRRAVVVVGDTPLLKMAVAGANLMATLSLVGEVELAHDIQAVLHRHSIARPSVGPATAGAR